MTKLNWRDASKELPRDEKLMREYLVCVKHVSGNKRVTTAFISRDHSNNYYFSGINYNEMVTHWMPISELPLPE